MINEIQIFLISMTPVGELRVSLPLALTIYQLNWLKAYFIAVLGNLIPVFFIFLFLKPILDFFFKKSIFFQKKFLSFFEKTKKSYNPRFKKFGILALVIFVAIPLPLTGAWTASLAALLYGIPFKKAFPLISLGVLIAGLIVSLITFAGISIEKYLGWQILIAIFLIIAFLLIMNKIINNNSAEKNFNF